MNKKFLYAAVIVFLIAQICIAAALIKISFPVPDTKGVYLIQINNALKQLSADVQDLTYVQQHIGMWSCIDAVDKTKYKGPQYGNELLRCKERYNTKSQIIANKEFADTTKSVWK